MSIFFINRGDELKYLEEMYRSNDFQLIIIYGRRRVGKTYLVKKFLEDKENYLYYYIADMGSLSLRIDFAEKIYEKLGIRLSYIPSWREIYLKIFEESLKKRIILVLDEFQRLLYIDRSAISILQQVIDEFKSNIMIICLGSSIGLMERIFEYRQPLYGRATGILKIKPFNFKNTYRFLKEKIDTSIENALIFYGVFGGTPHYLNMIKYNDPLKEIDRLLLNPYSLLYREPELLLKTELRESTIYFDILRLLAEGKDSFSELAGSLSSSKTSLTYYLNVLINDLDIVGRERPVDGERKGKKTKYRIKDNLYRFWFKYIYPNQSILELGERKTVLEKIRSDLNRYMGTVYEDIVKELLPILNPPIKPIKIGRWWWKDIEIDIVGIEGKKALLIEVKYGRIKYRDAVKIVERLEEKSRKIQYPYKIYGIAALEIENKDKLKNIYTIDIKDIEKALTIKRIDRNGD